jgi:hypothetical protein
MKELVDYLNGLKIKQTSIDLDDNNFPENIYEKYFENSTCLAEELNIDKHRWYETGLSVWETENGLLGVRSITNLYSESSDMEDMFYTLKFFEMEETTVVSYKQKS